MSSAITSCARWVTRIGLSTEKKARRKSSVSIPAHCARAWRSWESKTVDGKWPIADSRWQSELGDSIRDSEASRKEVHCPLSSRPAPWQKGVSRLFLVKKQCQLRFTRIHLPAAP